MDAGLLAAVASIGGAIIGAQTTIIVALIRRSNGQQHNPNFETLQMLLKQVLDSLKSLNEKMDQALQDLAGIKAKG